jgi:hypothetical protein
MLTLIGDIHGQFWKLHQMMDKAPPDSHWIQLGDFGVWPHREIDEGKAAVDITMMPRKIYMLDGNHEYYPMLPINNTKPTEIFNNLWYVPRGTLLELGGKTILCLGGAESPDKKWRTPGHDWFPEESLRYQDIERALSHVGKKIDLMLTHTAPMHIVTMVFGDDSPPEWNHSSKAVEFIWNELGRPPLYCGHLHTKFKYGNVTVIDQMQFLNVV